MAVLFEVIHPSAKSTVCSISFWLECSSSTCPRSTPSDKTRDVSSAADKLQKASFTIGYWISWDPRSLLLQHSSISLKLVESAGCFSRAWGEGKMASSSSEMSSSTKSQSVPFVSCLFNLTHFRHNPALDACPLSRSPLSLSLSLFRAVWSTVSRIRAPLSSHPRQSRVSADWASAQEDYMGAQWRHGPGPKPPPAPLLSSPPPIKTKSSSAPNVLETTDLTFCNASCMHASVHFTVYAYR